MPINTVLSFSLSRSGIRYWVFSSAMNRSECECCKSKPQILAVILDLDGTLLNTEMVTMDVLKEFLGKHGKVVDGERENRRLGMAQKEAAIAIVSNYNLPLTPEQFIKEITPMYIEKWPQAKPLPGANRVISHLHKHRVPFALASNSLRDSINFKISQQPGWKESFSVILGSDQVKEGKPAPYLFEAAAQRMGVPAASCLVIEDSLVGVKAANAAKMKVVAVPPRAEADCASKADVVLHSLLEFQPELWGLPPFDDWVNNALPIEPIYVNGLFSNGFLVEDAGDGPAALPDQVHGIFFGWAAISMHEIFKVVVAIGWENCSCTAAKRKTQLCLVDGEDDYINDQRLQLSLVGYIRGSNRKETTSMDVEILEEDLSTASVSLELPAFSHYLCMPFFPKASSLEEFEFSDEEE